MKVPILLKVCVFARVHISRTNISVALYTYETVLNVVNKNSNDNVEVHLSFEACVQVHVRSKHINLSTKECL